MTWLIRWSIVSGSCENVTCPGGKHCAHDQNGVPHCIHCRTNCRPSSPSELVCGGDGQTYSSLCALQRHTCLTGRPIRLAYRGNCQRTQLAVLFSRPVFAIKQNIKLIILIAVRCMQTLTLDIANFDNNEDYDDELLSNVTTPYATGS